MKKKIALIPIDNRPVCYELPKMITDISNDVELIMPNKEYLGSLSKSANTNALFSWLCNLKNIECIVISLDTLIYGGLINSRRSPQTLQETIQQLEKLKKILQKHNAKIYAFSSIMRISNNNINEEEKEYWSRWGKRIFDWSFNHHKFLNTNDSDALAKHCCISTTIPSEILEDYLTTRKRNFEINKIYLSWLKEGLLDFLVFAKDDCAEYGLNVIEANELQKIITENNLSAMVKTGADEIPLSLLSRIISENKQIKIYPKYTQPEGIEHISKYEDISVKNSVISQIDLAGAKISTCETDADFILFINNFKTTQGELVMNCFVEEFTKDFSLPNKPFAIADILNANGADNSFTNTLLSKDLSNLIGYSSWNTTGNTLGSVLFMAIMILCSDSKNQEAICKLFLTRFLDDWGYQANVRSKLKTISKFPDTKLLKEQLQPYETVLKKKFSIPYKHIVYSFPWNRFFEIEISIN